MGSTGGSAGRVAARQRGGSSNSKPIAPADFLTKASSCSFVGKADQRPRSDFDASATIRK